MNNMTINERIDFIQALDLPDTPDEITRLSLKGAESEGKEKEGYIDDGSLVSFVAGLEPLQKNDVLNSTLLAQLAANKKYDREKQTDQWYAFYRNVLENVGWVLSAFDFHRTEVSGSSFTVDQVVVKLLEAIASQNDIAVVVETLEAVKALSDDDGRLKLWESQSHSDSSGNFQIGVCANSDDVVVMKIGAFYFSTEQNVNKVLWFDFSTSKTKMYQGGQTINLNEQVYSQVRQAVLDKLGNRASEFVADLDI